MTWLQENWLKVLAIALALGAIAPIPYFAYYQLMNWVVVGAALLTAWQAQKMGNLWMPWVMALVVIVFNPIAPFYFSAQVWQYADAAVALVFVISMIVMRKNS